MSKSKLIMLISSIGVVVVLGVGSFLLISNKEAPQNNIEQTENNEEKSNNNENNDIHEDKSNINEEAQNKDSNINSNNETDNSQSKIEDGGNDNSSNNIVPNTENKEPSNSDSNYIAEIEQAIFQRVNQERTSAGVPALSYNTTMEKYARIKSKDMGDNGYFSHEDLQGNLITIKMQADGVSYRAWAENIAYIQGTDSNSALATKFMDNWMNSSGHRANILSTNYSSIGVGVYKIGDTYYATQEFYN